MPYHPDSPGNPSILVKTIENQFEQLQSETSTKLHLWGHPFSLFSLENECTLIVPQSMTAHLLVRWKTTQRHKKIRKWSNYLWVSALSTAHKTRELWFHLTFLQWQQSMANDSGKLAVHDNMYFKKRADIGQTGNVIFGIWIFILNCTYGDSLSQNVQGFFFHYLDKMLLWQQPEWGSALIKKFS